MACHILGTPNMAMRLGRRTSVECIKMEGESQIHVPLPDGGPLRLSGARARSAALKLYWYDRLAAQPKFEGVPEGELLGDDDINGSLFIGDKGMVTTGCYGERTRLVPASKMKDYKMPPQVLPRSPGPPEDWVRAHYRDWIRASKGGDAACSNFSVAGPFVQWMLLGVIAMRVEGKLLWDAQKMRITNNEEANQYLRPKFRKGWKFA